ncbi:MAG: DUF4190 domain-containing protein [Solirubrobacteraceae bacterium MAG38_C4-C5]|nr:DUF4190 domain-containing protein [Candidatus Siliceabacter maunaloa]
MGTGPGSEEQGPRTPRHGVPGDEHGVAPASPAPSESEGTSGFAIAAFVLGLLGAVVLAPIFGILALRRIKKRGQGGRGLAIAGLALSGAWTLVIAIGIGSVVFTEAERDAGGDVAEGGDLSVFEVQTGDCLQGVTETEAALNVEAVPCEQPHDAEVVADFELPEGDWPGLEPVIARAEERCAQLSAGLPPSPALEDGEIFFYHPTEQSWDTVDDREVLCLLTYPQPRTDSATDGA